MNRKRWRRKAGERRAKRDAETARQRFFAWFAWKNV
jgi:hypothetical protein